MVFNVSLRFSVYVSYTIYEEKMFIYTKDRRIALGDRLYPYEIIETNQSYLQIL